VAQGAKNLIAIGFSLFPGFTHVHYITGGKPRDWYGCFSAVHPKMSQKGRLCNPGIHISRYARIDDPGKLNSGYYGKIYSSDIYQALSGAGYPGVSALDAFGNMIPYIQNEEQKVTH
jgi:hypothetical protein